MSLTDDLVICTAGDAGYFELLCNCVRSIRERPEGQRVRLCVLDLGLEDEQRGWLRARQVEIATPGWDIAGTDHLPAHYRALTARPFLAKYFPGGDTYMWIDADAWVQDWEAVELYARAAADGAVACTPELDRSYRGLFEAWDEYHGVIEASYQAAFGAEVARDLTRLPLLNSGVFALKENSPSWGLWAEAIGEGFARTDEFLTEQAAFNLCVYRRGLRALFLPSWCNWAVHHAMPCWDANAQCFVEPALPHRRLGTLPLTIHTKRENTLPIRQVGGEWDGQVRDMRVRWP